MKIVRKSSFDHEDWRGDQYYVAENVPNKHVAKVMVDALNENAGPNSDDFYKVVADDYVLPPKWEP